MANHKSAKKRHRQSLTKNERNRSTKSAVRTTLKKARTAVESKDASAKDLARQAESALAKAASKGIINKKTARRTISRINSAAAKAK